MLGSAAEKQGGSGAVNTHIFFFGLTLKLDIFLKSSGRSFHKTAAIYLKEFLPQVVVRTLGISIIFEYLKLYLQSLRTTKSCKHVGESLLKILKHSIDIVRILLIFSDGTFAFTSNSSQLLTKSSYINRKALS